MLEPLELIRASLHCLLYDNSIVKGINQFLVMGLNMFCQDIFTQDTLGCEARADLVQNAVGSSHFFKEAFVVLRDPLPSTNFHNGINNTHGIV